ncbi:MAG: DUF1499 domain-containing protein [Myxococcota bacterium]
MAHSRTASLSIRLGVIGIVAFVVGPALAQLGWASPFVSFRIFGLSLLLGLLALVVGSVGLWRTRATSGREGRQSALAGASVGLLLVVIAVAPTLASGPGPVINDITTDVDDPPVFSAAQTDDANTGRDLAYPGEEFASRQREGYPDLEPIRVKASPVEAYAQCLAAAKALGWKITMQDAATGRFEAIDVTSIFRFIDDIAVRVRPGAGGAVVDVRSKSRDGKGDMGANTARIRAFRSELSG